MAASLWDGWTHQARRLQAALDHATGLADRFMVSAAVLHYLLADPLLPQELLPHDWPGPDLRRHYERIDTVGRKLLRDHLRA